MVGHVASSIQDSPSGRFAAFSFVDRITRIDGITQVCGVYTIPAHATRFPVSLVAEAIGQLAAWVAMSTVAFSRRPVAALAGDTRIFSAPRPGDTLELQVDIESCDAEAITYRGRATVGGKLVLELLDTLGSMLDISEFDDPVALAADFAVLTSTGRTPGCFAGVPQPVLTDISHEAARSFPASPGFSGDADAGFPVATRPAHRIGSRRLPGARHTHHPCQGPRLYPAGGCARIVGRARPAGAGRSRTPAR